MSRQKLLDRVLELSDILDDDNVLHMTDEEVEALEDEINKIEAELEELSKGYLN